MTIVKCVMHTSMNWKYETIISADSAHRFPYSIFWGVSVISILGKAGYAPHFKCAPCSPHNDSPFYRRKPGVKPEIHWNPLKSRCFLFAWTFSDRGSPNCNSSGMSSFLLKTTNMHKKNLLTWFWSDFGVSTALSGIVSSVFLLFDFSGRLRWVGAIEDPGEPGRGRSPGDFSHLGHWVDLFVGPIFE